MECILNNDTWVLHLVQILANVSSNSLHVLPFSMFQSYTYYHEQINSEKEEK